MAERVCLVTVHGIGFQQAPGDGVPGYADGLHASLRAQLGGELGDDPCRGGGPVYVRSEVDRSSSKGLARLDNDKPPSSGGSIAHVALVYSPSEPLVPRAGSAADTPARRRRAAQLGSRGRREPRPRSTPWRSHAAVSA